MNATALADSDVNNKTNEKVLKYLQTMGLSGLANVIYNPHYEELFEHETDPNLGGFDKGVVTEMGAVSVNTGQYTGRSPRDKYIVHDDATRDTIWWSSEENGNDNKAITAAIWNDLKQQAVAQLSDKKLYIIDAYCGANHATRLSVRFVVEVAWQAHFVKNMFIQPSGLELEQFEPDFLVLNASKAKNPRWQSQGLNSETFVAFNLTEHMQIIGGTWYGGEMKKGLFSMMNYYLPRQGIASMHSSANIGKKGDVALFFGLSGTGKTTLSADPNRALIGDDEHGWDDDGIFNLEGGCYAKTIDLDPAKEPEIYKAIKRNALLENVVVSKSGELDFSDTTITQNGRVSYPIDHIDNIARPWSKGGHASKIIFLTADAFGVLPAVAKLNEEQAQYHYLSGFTAKIAGTELGVIEPSPTFSACFGQAFLSLHPTHYARELSKRMKAAGASVYLVNTGWNGRGERISLAETRAIINAILDGHLENSDCNVLPHFELLIPASVPGVSDHILDPRNSHDNHNEWQTRALKLAELFVSNFSKFADDPHGKYLVKFGPQLD